MSQPNQGVCRLEIIDGDMIALAKDTWVLSPSNRNRQSISS